MKEVDKVIHAERAISGGGKWTYDALLVELPHGAIFEHEDVAYLFTTAGYLQWSFEGYGAQRSMDAATLVKVLTPRSIVRAFDAGLVPIVHQSANR